MSRKYEGSPQDRAEDKRGAGLLGVSMADYEKTPRDRAEDRRGQAKMAANATKVAPKGRKSRK